MVYTYDIALLIMNNIGILILEVLRLIIFEQGLIPFIH